MVGMEGMRVPVWLTLGVALLVCVFGAYRIRLAFRSDAEDERARQRRGLYSMGRRTHFLVGLIYLLLGGALVATSFGWNPFAGVLGPREAPRKEPPTTMRVAPGTGESVTFTRDPNAGSGAGSAAAMSPAPSAAPATTEPRAPSATDPGKTPSAEPTSPSK